MPLLPLWQCLLLQYNSWHCQSSSFSIDVPVSGMTAGAGGALHLSDTATLRIAPHAQQPHTYHQSLRYTTIITNNTAKDLGGGVSINQDSSFDVDALVAVAHGNKAMYDPDVSVPLKEIQVVGPAYKQGIVSR